MSDILKIVTHSLSSNDDGVVFCVDHTRYEGMAPVRNKQCSGLGFSLDLCYSFKILISSKI